MLNFFVYGGCISRDVFNPEYNKGKLNLAKYTARYSVAKLADPAVRLSIDSSLVTSKFQTKILKNESENNLLRAIKNTDFDCFLMDIMFLKYRLAFYKNTWLTYSSELKRSKIINSHAKMISPSDDLFWDKFEEGIKLLFSSLEKKQMLDRTLINKIFLATKDNKGELLENQDLINTQNEWLRRGYQILEKYLPKKSFLTYDERFFVANPEHRWGLDPMHYIDEFYHKSYLKLITLDKN